MARIITRKCATCGSDIKIDRNDIHDVVIYDKRFYHKQCLVEYAMERLQQPRCKKEKWNGLINNIDKYENQARENLGHGRPTDKLNDWLIDHYNLTATPSDRFWSTIREIGNGFYRNKRCKAINIDDLTEAWKWAQHNLDKIATNNKSMNKKMEGEARLYYDLAIILRKYSFFLKWKDRQKAAAAVAAAQEATRMKINYSNLERQVMESKKETDDIGDISDLLDELF